MLVAMRPEVVDALELLLVEERGVEAREWVDEALLAVGQAKRLYAGEAPGIRVAPRPQTVGVDPQHPCEIGRAALASYQVYAEYRTNTGKYAAPQWVNGWCDDFRFGMPKEFRLGHALVEAGLMPKPCRHPDIFVHEGVCKACGKTGLP